MMAKKLISLTRQVVTVGAQHHFDYSSISTLLDELGSLDLTCLSPLGELSTLVGALKDAIEPTTGHGMFRIWSRLLIKPLSAPAREQFDTLRDVGSTLDVSKSEGMSHASLIWSQLIGFCPIRFTTQSASLRFNVRITIKPRRRAS